MKDLLKKYYKMTDEERDELEDLYLLHELQCQLQEYDDLELTISDEEIIFEAARICLFYGNIKGSEIISRLLGLIEYNYISTDDIDEATLEELMELVDV